MPPLKRWSQRQHQRPCQHGFTLVEALIMMVVLLISLAGVAAIFTIISRNTGEFQSADQEDGAVAFDISEILRINSRYTCKDVNSATASCTISSTDLSQNDYFPTTTDGQTNFRDRCTYQNSLDLVTDLAAQIPASSQASSALTAAGVTRTLITNDQGNAHRYTVTYSRGGTIQRIITLVPTAASWCP